MKVKSFIAPALLTAFALSLAVNAGFAAPAAAQEKGKQAKKETVYIPKEIKAVLQQGLAAKQGRQDIPVSLDRQFFLPAGGNYYNYFYIKMKNSDLGFVPAAKPGAQPAAKPDAQPAGQPQSGDQFQANFNIFLDFNKIEPGKAPQSVKEIYVPTNIVEDAAAYDAQKENVYSFGYPLPPGNYLLALAVTSLDLKKIGTLYVEFTLPDQKTYSENLDATFLFSKKLENLDAPENRTLLHKDCFSYSILKVYPKFDSSFSVGDNFEIFMFVLGAQPTASDPQKVVLDASYEVKKGEETTIRWNPTVYEIPLIMQPLPLKQTKQTKEGDKVVKTETVDLAAGNYTLLVKLTDKTSGKTLTKSIPFEVK